MSDSSLNIVLKQSGKKIFDQGHVSQIFNEFYTTIASDFVSKSPTPCGIFSGHGLLFKNFYSERLGLCPSFILSAVRSHFIRCQLYSLNPKKAVGLDDMSSLFSRDASDFIVTHVTQIQFSKILKGAVHT